MAFYPLRPAILCAVLTLALAHASPASAEQLLQNGGFELGSSGWNGPSLSTSTCVAYGGSSALSVTNFAQQNLPSPIGSGSYTLEGWLKAKAAPADVTLSFVWFDSSGSELATANKDVAAGSDYAAFSFTRTAPAGSHGLRLRISTSGNPVCLDDLSLDGPPPLPPATPTSPPSQQSTSPTSTPTASATPKPTSTPAPTIEPAPGLDLINGGFEDGLTGWSKFGGTLSLVDGPVATGLHAGRLTSTTDSTKWAYQPILVDASRFYEFAGYVAGDAGVSRAYLRVSWYASTDGSGVAIANTDSSAAIEGVTAYVFLSTGPVAPPGTARSARARVVMTPAGAGTASIIFDDLWFAAVPPPAAEPPSVSQPSAVAPVTAASAPTANRRNDTSGVQSNASGRTTSEVRSAAAPAATPGPRLSGPLGAERDHDRGVPLLWLAAAGAFVLLLGAAYLQGRRHPA